MKLDKDTAIAMLQALIAGDEADTDEETTVTKVPSLPNIPNLDAEFYVSAKGEKTGSIQFTHKLQKEVYSNGNTKPLKIWFGGMFNANGTMKDATSCLLNLKNARQKAEMMMDIIEYYEGQMGLAGKQVEQTEAEKKAAIILHDKKMKLAKAEKEALKLKAELGL